MNIKICALAIVAFGTSSLAQASGSYSAGFTLLGTRLPPLLTGSGADDPSVPAPGHWLDNGSRTARINTADLIPGTDGGPATWGNETSGPSKRNYGNVPTSLGEIRAMTYGGFAETYGSASVYWKSIGASIILQGDAGRGAAEATWTRSFSLDAHSSFTFAGLGSLGITDPFSTPLAASSSFLLDTSQSFASLTLADAADRVGTRISASIFGLTGLGSSVFSHTTDASGLMSLTISNPFDTAISGSLRAGSYVNVLALGDMPSLASPVPEPSTWLTLALGLGIVGAMTRRKPAQPSPLPAPMAC
jgi:hypothetical protein